MQGVTLYWLRQDLRLHDNPALCAALAHNQPVIVVYVLDESADWSPGGAQKWWLHHSLSALQTGLEKLNLKLTLKRGDSSQIIEKLAQQHNVTHVHWNRCYEPQAIARDTELKQKLQTQGVTVASHNSALLHEPWEISTKDGGPYKVFTPFWRKGCLPKGAPAQPLATPAGSYKTIDITSDDLDQWQLLPTTPNWSTGFNVWQPGEVGAQQRLTDFLENGLSGYKELRNRPDLPHVSRLSAHLHFGEISVADIWHQTEAYCAAHDVSNTDKDHFFSELGWREFSYHLLYHFPTLPTENWKSTFNDYPWADDEGWLQAWQRGQTGYPIVDAAMRELWTTGWMHNRTRMVVASFLIKHLRIHWKHGTAWFWDTLLDADLANNSASWQWVAGSGADASPYFRIFNPITQGEKFDPKGDYVRQWVPELAKLPNELLHKPWEAAPIDLLQAGVKLGETYPHPIVDHQTARNAALAGYEHIKKAR